MDTLQCIPSNLFVDIARSRSLLNMGLMLSVTPAERAGLASCLCDIGMYSLNFHGLFLISF